MIQVRPTTYRRQEGYTVCGYPPEPFRKAFPVRIFTTTRASEIAQSILAGNTALAHYQILSGGTQYEAAALALDVTYELHLLFCHDGADIASAWSLAYAKVSRCLEGAT